MEQVRNTEAVIWGKSSHADNVLNVVVLQSLRIMPQIRSETKKKTTVLHTVISSLDNDECRQQWSFYRPSLLKSNMPLLGTSVRCHPWAWIYDLVKGDFKNLIPQNYWRQCHLNDINDLRPGTLILYYFYAGFTIFQEQRASCSLMTIQRALKTPLSSPPPP